MCIARGCRTVYPKIAPEKVEGKLPTEQSFHKFPMKKSELLQNGKLLCAQSTDFR